MPASMETQTLGPGQGLGMKTQFIGSMLSLIVGTSIPVTHAGTNATLAFPTAEGHGRFAADGRGDASLRPPALP